MLGFEPGAMVDMRTIWFDDESRRVERFRIVPYDIPRGCIAAYYPETNPLVPLDSKADVSGTPTSKSIPVLLSLSEAITPIAPIALTPSPIESL